MIENLESRLLLSSTLVDGVLTVQGSSGPDVISVVEFGSRLGISEGERVKWFNASRVRSIMVLGKAGNDVIRAERCDLPVFVDGGKGHDLIIGGSARDSLVGGAGSDRIMGGDGDDVLDGGDGRDVMLGGFGNDTFYAAADQGRRDSLDGGQGNDFSDARDRSRGIERFAPAGVSNAVVIIADGAKLIPVAVNLNLSTAVLTANTGVGIIMRTPTTVWQLVTPQTSVLADYVNGSNLGAGRLECSFRSSGSGATLTLGRTTGGVFNGGVLNTSGGIVISEGAADSGQFIFNDPVPVSDGSTTALVSPLPDAGSDTE